MNVSMLHPKYFNQNKINKPIYMEMKKYFLSLIWSLKLYIHEALQFTSFLFFRSRNVLINSVNGIN